MRRRKQKIIRLFKITIKTGFVVIFFSVGLMFLWAASLSIPELKSFEERKVQQSTKIYDRSGEILLFDVHENIQRTVVPLSEMSRNIKNATVAIEDSEFYEHKGIKLGAIFRAVLVNVGAGEFSQGGSTITQQVVKNSILTSDKKISRKLKEWILAVKLEKELSKEKILEFYLNESPYGGNIYGVEEASEMFFGKTALELTLSESAYLAALPQAPTYYSPYRNNRDKLENRKNLVLERMFISGFITKDEYNLALEEVVEFLPQRASGIQAPHFVFFIMEYLENKYGKRVIEEGGFKITTTLDFELQQIAEDTVRKFAIENEEKFNAENAGLVAIDPKTGQILVMVGSRNYFDEKIDGNFNVAISPNRQPGSSFKPFVYAAAFEKGYTPDTVVFDLRTQFAARCQPDNLTSEGNCYSPVNYDNTFKGPITFRNALAQSVNIPSVKVLYLAGLNESIKTARSMGIQSLTDINRYGLTLVLGGGEVSLIDMTSAYGVFANDGVRNPYASILKIEDGDGNVVEEFAQKSVRVIEENIARQISDILSDNEARAPAFGQYSPLYFEGRDVAAKTGTTNDYVDAWIIGYTPNISVGAWAGNNDNRSMEKKVAGFVVAPMWNVFMKEVLSKREIENFKKPEKEDYTNLKPSLKGMWQGGVSYFVDKISGKLATEYTPNELKEERVIRNTHSILFWVDKNDPLGPAPKNPDDDPQFESWEYSVKKWKEEKGIVDEEQIIPTEFDDVHKPEFGPKIIITSPISGVKYANNSKITVTINNTGKYLLSKVDYFVNDIFIGSSKEEPFSLSFTPADLDIHIKKNVLKVVGYDGVLNRGQVETVFLVDI